jgi:Xaa-Pro aminopeptidase
LSAKHNIQSIRAGLRPAGIHAFLIPNDDPHASEYVPDHWKRRQFATGFSGSVGEAVVTQNTAALWVDSRYFLQAERELKGSGILLQKIGLPGTPSLVAWLSKSLPKKGAIGVDPQTLSRARFLSLSTELAEVGLQLVAVKRNPVDAAWSNRAPLPRIPLEVHEVKDAGESLASKLRRVRAEMKTRNASSLVINELDAIAWLFNLRGRDVEYNPVFVSYAIVTQNSAHLFVDLKKVTSAVRKHLGSLVKLHRYDAFATSAKSLSKSRGKVWIPEATTTQWIYSLVGKAALITERSPITLMKASKLPAQVKGIRSAHIRDGVAMVKFLAWLDMNMGKIPMSELSLEVELERARCASKLYKGPSFSPIIGYGANGAVVHYRAVTETNLKIKPRGLMVIDSGGQYADGTTDITRTVACGTPTRLQREHFTRVLKGHIAIATTPFPVGTRGAQLDILARRSLWQAGLNYMHGTGHGVGHYLCVHEGPHSIAPRFPNEPLVPGMVVSNEPGYYLSGEYGIRIENLVVVVTDEQRPGFNRMSNLTVCPIDLRLVEAKLLTDFELAYLNAYHKWVYGLLKSKVRGKTALWLKNATKSI